MSAIFGIIDFKGRPLKDEWITSMKSDLSHRGPDGQGLYREESVAIGHMLLQVTPESVYDRSPYEEDGFVITAYARLDERDAIMDRLGITGDERNTITDPLLLLRSFRKFGKDFVKDIYGDFAFAIWDIQKRELFCARDQMGVKPLLYSLHDGRFVFATEIRSIVNLSFFTRELDHNYLLDRAVEIWNDPDRTPWKYVYYLRPANTITAVKTGLSKLRYWEPRNKRNQGFITEKDSATVLKRTIERVIADHTRVIGEVGVPLSGGLDSGTIACLAASKLKGEGKKVRSVSSVFSPGISEIENPDEMNYITDILKQESNIEPEFIYNSDLNFFKGLKEKIKFHYTPVNAFYYVDEAIFKQLNLKGVRRSLSGYLGDMTVSNSLINPFTILVCEGRFLALKRLIDKYKLQTGLKTCSVIKAKIVRELMPKFLLRLLYKIKGREIEKLWDISKLPLNFNSGEKKEVQKRLIDSFRLGNRRLSKRYPQIWPADYDFLGAEWDCEASHHRVEMTYPLIDRRLVELLLTIPSEHFYSGGRKRGLIREAMRDILPETVRLRSDKGWYSPGYPQIIFSDLPEMIKLIEGEKLYRHVSRFLDWARLKIMLKKLSETNNNDSFAYDSWVLIDLMLLILFEGWMNPTESDYEKNDKKEMETASNKG